MFPGIPQYANGVGIPSDSTVIQGINRVREATRERERQVVVNTPPVKDYDAKLEAMINLLQSIVSKPNQVQALLDANSFNRANEPYQASVNGERNKRSRRGLAVERRL